MKQLLSLPLVPGVLAEYGGWDHFPCDGIEAVWGGEDFSYRVPRRLRIGYHLTFWPDWLDLWLGDRTALLRKFGSERAWTAFYGGGRDALLSGYRADLERAVAWGAEYVVFHVSDVSLEEGYTYRWEHSHQAVIDAAAQCINLLLDGRDWPFALLVENQWWPGFTFTCPDLTARLLDAIRYPRKGILLDTGHLLNANPDLKNQCEGVAYLHRMLDEHGALTRYIRGVHLHQSISGAYVKAHTGSLPEGWADEPDYLKRFGVSYGHILRIDTHSPWTCPEIAGIIRRLEPDWLVHELSAPCRAERERKLRLQLDTLRRGQAG